MTACVRQPALEPQSNGTALTFATPLGPQLFRSTRLSARTATVAAMAHCCQPRDNGERFEDSPRPTRSRSPVSRKGFDGAAPVPSLAHWQSIETQVLMRWWENSIRLGVYSMADIQLASKTFTEVLRFCGQRSATLPFALALRLCAQLQAAMDQQSSPPESLQVPLFGTDLDPVPDQRSLCHLRLLPEPRKHALQLGLFHARPLFTKMLSLEPGLQKHFVLRDLQCLIDDVLYVLASESIARANFLQP